MSDNDFFTRFGRSMRKVSMHIIIVAIVGAIISVFILRKPLLSGGKSHDFGIVSIADSKTSVQHMFHLTNTTEQSIDIRSIKPDCGCTTAIASSMQIAPKAAVDIAVTLEVSKHGKKESVITLDLGERGLQFLKVKASGKMLPRLFCPLDHILLVPDMRTGEFQPVAVPVYAYVFGSGALLSGLEMSSPIGVDARFSGWALKHQPKDSSSPTEWEGQILVSRGSGEVSSGAQLQLRIDGGLPLNIPVTMAQSLTESAESRPAVTGNLRPQ